MGKRRVCARNMTKKTIHVNEDIYKRLFGVVGAEPHTVLRK